MPPIKFTTAVYTTVTMFYRLTLAPRRACDVFLQPFLVVIIIKSGGVENAVVSAAAFISPVDILLTIF